MDSSAYQVLLIPVCQGICLGLFAGLVIHLTLKWLAALIADAAPDSQERLSLSKGSPPSPKVHPLQGHR
ncbi:hypothetical protein V5E97_01290 [Singulisphaera sp. Ch08]|uniref:Uncharacterized protein n=1 Tax=Singulisphaera sp. Ch08 TaxID=3120278 RepID=A0AAU7CHT9_9BACT